MKLLRVQTPLGLFSSVWAVAAALHYLEARPLAGLPIYPFVILLLVYPERLWAIAGFALAHASLIWLNLPAAANHSVLGFMVDACLLIGCAKVVLRSKDPESRGRQLWEGVQGPIRATVVIVYFFAVFHKLNSSFFDPTVSCATSQLAKMFVLHGFAQPTDMSILSGNIYATLILELVILVLLLWPRFAHVGVTIGLAFHTALAWAQFFDFATVIFALYLFFLPWDGIQRELDRIRGWAGAGFVVGLGGLAATSFVFHGVRENPVIFTWPGWSLHADTLICAFWTLMVWPVLLPIFLRSNQPPARAWTGAALAWGIPVIALVNGATPYLGLKTVANYSMFSNLRTEAGHTNHFLVPAGLFFLSDYQNDLARVESVIGYPPALFPWVAWLAEGDRGIRRNARWLADVPHARVPFMEVKRTLQHWKDVGFSKASITYARGGERYQVENAFSDQELMRPLTFWERKLLAFRAVQDDGQQSRCRW